MKTLLILLCSFVFLKADVYTQKLYVQILGSVFQERPIVIFTDKDAQENFQNTPIFQITNKCDKADVVVGSDYSTLDEKCEDIPVFATSYKAYIDNPHSFGAFYWKKGRPQIHFNQKNIERFQLFLPKKFMKYVD